MSTNDLPWHPPPAERPLVCARLLVGIVLFATGSAVTAQSASSNSGIGDVEFVNEVVRLLETWGPCPSPCPYDLDNDGIVDGDDFVAVLAAPSRETIAAFEGPFSTYEAHLRYLDDYPFDLGADWSDDVQGITNDGESHWYLTRTEVLLRVPVSQDLNGDLRDKPGVTIVNLRDIPALDCYEHFGDISYYSHAGNGYILVPVETPQPCCAVMAVFRADASLAYLGSGCIPGQAATAAAWLAVDPEGFVYSSTGNPTVIRKYQVGWDSIESGVSLTHVTDIPLLDESGSPYQLYGMQGGVITASGEVIYLCNGVGDCDNPTYGLHAFNLSSGQRIARSCQTGCLFRFEFDVCDLNILDEEPEGLTIWDLDGGQAPGMSGQLHVMLLNNELPLLNDNIFFKHYSGRVYVDDLANNGDGTLESPFNNVSDAVEFAWDGCTFVIDGGQYPESVLIDKHVRMRGKKGIARIGN